MATSGNRKSFVLLNQTERDWLSGKKRVLSSKLKYDLRKKLDKKFKEMEDDMKLIIDSKNLQDWRDMGIYKGNTFSKLEELFKKLGSMHGPKIIYISKFKSVTSGNKTKYWLELKSWNHLQDDLKNKKLKTKKLYYNEKIFRPKFMLRELKARKETEKLIMKLWEKGSLPQNPKNAITLDQIKKKLKS